MPRCIYCDNNEANSGEHYLPACMGKFRNFEQLYDRLCTECNGKISSLEEQFCRCGPEAFFRIFLGIKGRNYHKKVNPFYRGSSGGKRIVIETKHPSKNCQFYCEMEKGQLNAFPARQFIVVDPEGNHHSILITERIKESKDLLEELKKEGLENSRIVECWYSQKEEEWINELCRGHNVKINLGETLPYQNMGNKQFVTTFTINDKYFRAIAKIGFHYFLKHFSHFTGVEKEFDGIKDFIMNGGDTDNWVRQIKGSFVWGLKPGVTTDKFGHLIAVDKNENEIISKMHFFVGPKGAPPQYYQVYIGRNTKKIIYPENMGHQFVYFDEVDQEGYNGRMDPMHSIPLNIIP